MQVMEGEGYIPPYSLDELTRGTLVSLVGKRRYL